MSNAIENHDTDWELTSVDEMRMRIPEIKMTMYSGEALPDTLAFPLEYVYDDGRSKLCNNRRELDHAIAYDSKLVIFPMMVIIVTVPLVIGLGRLLGVV